MASAAATRTPSRYTTIIDAMTEHCAVYRDGREATNSAQVHGFHPPWHTGLAVPVL